MRPRDSSASLPDGRPAFARVDEVGQPQAGEQHARGDQQQLVDPDRLDQVSGDEAAEYRARGGAEGDDDKQPLAGLRRVQVVSEGPELGRHHEVEDADPQVEGDGHRHPCDSQKIEGGEAGGEEHGDAVDQAAAVMTARQPGVQRHRTQQQ